MVFHLCFLFDGSNVDGINFQKIEPLEEVRTFTGQQREFNSWLKKFSKQPVDTMISEYIRLTNIAFAADCSFPPVFLLDEVQHICTSRPCGNNDVTYMSALLNTLAYGHQPVCICAGTRDGKSEDITDRSSFLPQIFSLTTLGDEYWQNWKEMTDHYGEYNRGISLSMAKDRNLINALAFAAHKIPRLLVIAHQTWLDCRGSHDEFVLQTFEKKARVYYQEMQKVWSKLPDRDIAHVILCRACRWRVTDVNKRVPGTGTRWSDFIRDSLIFPYISDDRGTCYTFPFRLVWPTHNGELIPSDPYNSELYERLVTIWSTAIPNLDINSLFVSFLDICNYDIGNQGRCFEEMIASSIAVKYYLRKVSQSFIVPHASVSFDRLYEFELNDPAYKLLRDLQLGLPDGLGKPGKPADMEATVYNSIQYAVVHNKNFQNAHHDIILNATQGGVPISVKASFDLSSGRTIQNQLRVSKSLDDRVSLLIWVYLGDSPKETKYGNVAFIDGSGVCNGLCWDMFRIFKQAHLKTNRALK